MKLEFSRQFSKNAQVSSFIKIRPVGAEVFHAEGRTDMKKLIVAFRNFGNTPNQNHDERSWTAFLQFIIATNGGLSCTRFGFH
jgi:hypothetical protein